MVGFGISLPNLREPCKRLGALLPFGWIHLLKALKKKPKVIDLYLTGVLPEYQSKGVNALLFNDLIPVYKRIGAVYAESNPELRRIVPYKRNGIILSESIINQEERILKVIRDMDELNLNDTTTYGI